MNSSSSQFSFSHVCKEVVQALSAFWDTQAVKTPKAELHIAVHVISKHKTQCSLEVGFSGIGSYYMDGRAFLQCLVISSQHLKKALISGAAPAVLLQCRRIGEYSTVSQYTVICGAEQTQASVDVDESLVDRPAQFPGLVFKLVKVPVDDISVEMEQLTVQLHLLHLISPQVAFLLRVRGLPGASLSVTYDHEPSLTICGSLFHLAAPLWHYVNTDLVQTKQTKLKVLKGSTHHISDHKLAVGGDRLAGSIKLFCCVAVSPHLRLSKGKKIPADRVCHSLHVTVFGPGSVPLLDAGSHAGFLPSCLARWEDYGLTPVTPVTAAPTGEHMKEGNPSVCIPSFLFELKQATPSNRGPRTGSSIKHNRVLHLFIFVEGSKCSSPHQQWRCSMKQVAALREDFSGFVTAQTKTFHKAVHSALNKLICNYGSHSKASLVVSTCVPLLAEAIGSIVSHSSNELFRRECLQMTQASSLEGIQEKLHQQLWSLAENKLLCTENSEPTTPELEAVSLSSPTRNRQRKRRTTSLQTITPVTAAATTDHCSPVPTHAAQIDQCWPVSSSEPTIGEGLRSTHSLFSARVALASEHSDSVQGTAASTLSQTALPLLPVQDGGSHLYNTQYDCREDTELTTTANTLDDDHFDALTKVGYSPSLPTHEEEPLSSSQSESCSAPFLTSNPHVIPYSQSSSSEFGDHHDLMFGTNDHSDTDSFTDFSDCEIALSPAGGHSEDGLNLQDMGDSDDFDTLATGVLISPHPSLNGGQDKHCPAAGASYDHTAVPTTQGRILEDSFDELLDLSFGHEDVGKEEEIDLGKVNELVTQGKSHFTCCGSLSVATHTQLTSTCGQPPKSNRCPLDTDRGQQATISDQEWEEALEVESPVEDLSSPFINFGHEPVTDQHCVPLPLSESGMRVETWTKATYPAEVKEELMAEEEEDEEEEEEEKEEETSDFAFLEDVHVEFSIGNN